MGQRVRNQGSGIRAQVSAPSPSFRNPLADVRNPGITIAYWIPDLDYVSSGMTIVAIFRVS